MKEKVKEGNERRKKRRRRNVEGMRDGGSEDGGKKILRGIGMLAERGCQGVIIKHE